MKKLLIIPMLFACYIGMSQAIDSAWIIGKPIRVEQLLVAQNDFANRMDWYDAKKACAALGNGWRLPTMQELYDLYQNRDKIGSFASGSHWSSTEDLNNYAWGQVFYNGLQLDFNKSNPNYVRAVRAF
jgi:formylglycine-generating enzyme required for sulfatase activity